MEKKNMVLLTVIAVATLLVAVVGATFAYFTATVQDQRTEENGQGETNIETSKIASKTVVANVSNEAGKFTAKDVYPGHKEIAAIQVDVTGTAGDESAIAINYKATTNDLYNDATITVYGLDATLSIPNTESTSSFFDCQKQTKPAVSGEANTVLYWEECSSNEDKGLLSAKKIGETQIIPNDSSELTFKDIITLESGSATKYYYVVIEFENDDEDESGTSNQNTLEGKSLDGKITVSAA